MRTARHLLGITSALFITGLALSAPAVAAECTIANTKLASDTTPISAIDSTPENLRWYLRPWQATQMGPTKVCVGVKITNIDAGGSGTLIYGSERHLTEHKFQVGSNGKFTVDLGRGLVVTFEAWDKDGKRLLYMKDRAGWDGAFHPLEQVTATN